MIDGEIKMVFRFEKMNQQEAEDIALHWKYSGVYSFYDCTADADDYSEFMDASRRGDKYYACYMAGEMIGFYSVEISHGDTAELGLGLKPEYTGRGMGLRFVCAVLKHILSLHRVRRLALSVALFNQRAIKVYKAAGFTETGTFTQRTNGGEYEFLGMEKACIFADREA